MSDQAKPRKARHAATLADVGREAGVSAMAASTVLNGARTSTRISDETRQRILAAADKLQYRPNATARGLAERRLNTIGLATTLSGNELNQYFLEVFNGVIEAAAAAGQNTTVFAMPDWQQVGSRLPAICDGRIDGLILLAPLINPDDAAQLPDHTPFVAIHANHAMPGVGNVASDEEAGAHAMVAHMLSLGHRRVLHLAGPNTSSGAQRRIDGFRRAHAEAGLTVNPGQILHSDYSASSGRRVLTEWLERHRGQPMPEAIFAANDAVALGCIDILAGLGLRVPQDVSVVGFDDTLLARTTRLATVRQPLRDMGHQAVSLLMQAIEAKHRGQPARQATEVLLPTELVPGQTLSAPPADTVLIP
ncbi:LacI family DNA-binding transcriptional regulator [Ideonella margarita]|uniref:LacI family DNA-binding transcriptional regulator n=1 Tax=Ideonella margarita TaxID=2984191 RepID=A0ABU9C1T9_9BURK